MPPRCRFEQSGPVRSPLCPLGHIADYQELLERFNGQESAVLPFRYAYPNATVVHLRSNVYVCAHLDDEAMVAARIGAVLDCVTVLARHGLPVDDRHQLHLRFRRNDGRANKRRRAETREIRAHWALPARGVPTLSATAAAAYRGNPISRLELPLEEALRPALTSCLSAAESVKVLDAVLPRIGAAALTDILAGLPAGTRARLRRASPTAAVGDALESLR